MLIQVIDDRLANPGDSFELKGHLDLASYKLGEHDFDLAQGLDYDLVLTNAGEGILATGMVNAEVEGTCDRCLGPAHLSLAAEVDEYYLFHEPDAAGEESEEDDADYSLVSDDNTIDLYSALEAALIMETPFIVLCTDECAGLCPVCGANLNEHDCGHAEEILKRQEQEKLEANPFAVLKNLDLPDA